MRYFLSMPIGYIGYIQDSWLELLHNYGVAQYPTDLQDLICNCFLNYIDAAVEEYVNNKVISIDFVDAIEDFFDSAPPRYGIVGYMYKIYDLFEDTNAEGGCIISGKMVSKLKINMYREPWRSYPETILDVFSDKLSETLIECFEHVLCQDENMQDTIAHYLRKSLITKFKGSVTSNYFSRKFLVTC